MSYRNAAPDWSVWSKDTINKDDLGFSRHRIPLDIARTVVENAKITETAEIGLDDKSAVITYALLDDSGVVMIEKDGETEAYRDRIQNMENLVNWVLWKNLESIERFMGPVPCEVTDPTQDSLFHFKRVSEESGIVIAKH